MLNWKAVLGLTPANLGCPRGSGCSLGKNTHPFTQKPRCTRASCHRFLGINGKAKLSSAVTCCPTQPVQEGSQLGMCWFCAALSPAGLCRDGLWLRAGTAAPEHHPTRTAVEMLRLLRAGREKICFCDAFAVLQVHSSH